MPALTGTRAPAAAGRQGAAGRPSSSRTISREPGGRLGKRKRVPLLFPGDRRGGSRGVRAARPGLSPSVAILREAAPRCPTPLVAARRSPFGEAGGGGRSPRALLAPPRPRLRGAAGQALSAREGAARCLERGAGLARARRPRDGCALRALLGVRVSGRGGG